MVRLVSLREKEVVDYQGSGRKDSTKQTNSRRKVQVVYLVEFGTR